MEFEFKDGYKSSMASPSHQLRGKLMSSPSPIHLVKWMASPSHSTKSDGKSKSFDKFDGKYNVQVIQQNYDQVIGQK